jgi:peptide/nickel transport system permease protein
MYKGETYTIISYEDIYAFYDRHGQLYANASLFLVQARLPSTILSIEYIDRLKQAIYYGERRFTFPDATGEIVEYSIVIPERATLVWDIERHELTRIINRYEFPSRSHWLGLDGAGMDVLTRIMYGGRWSLVIGFVVVGISVVIGVYSGRYRGLFRARLACGLFPGAGND